MTAPRILVVDDEPNIRDLLITSLRFAGFQVRAVLWREFGIELPNCRILPS